MAKLAEYSNRVGDSARISRGYDEANDKEKGLIREDVSAPADWSEVVLQGPHFFVATPFAKQPPDMGRQDKVCDLTKLAANAVPTTKYRRACDIDASTVRLRTNGVTTVKSSPLRVRTPEFYRLTWRRNDCG